MNWPESLNKKIKTEVNLAKQTTFKIGGPADFYFEAANLKELKDALCFAKSKKIPVFILGSGSNILVSDKGVKGLVIKLAGACFRDIYIKGSYVFAAGGLKLNQLVLFAKEKGLSGLEFLSGIPGTVGGSLLGNAGAWGKSIGGLVNEVSVLDYAGKQKILRKRFLKFSYRKSNLNKYIILWASFKLKKENKQAIASKIKKFIIARKTCQNIILPNAGCIFKNPANILGAGKLIDLCGLKGKRIGGALVSPRHANFIVNCGRAKANDVLSLMELVKKQVRKKFKVSLKPEIKLWK